MDNEISMVKGRGNELSNTDKFEKWHCSHNFMHDGLGWGILFKSYCVLLESLEVDMICTILLVCIRNNFPLIQSREAEKGYVIF